MSSLGNIKPTEADPKQIGCSVMYVAWGRSEPPPPPPIVVPQDVQGDNNSSNSDRCSGPGWNRATKKFVCTDRRKGSVFGGGHSGT